MGALLNVNLSWEQLEPSNRDAFSGIGQKVLLNSGFRLYKFTAGDIEGRPDPPNPPPITPWWSPINAYEWDAGLQARLKFAKQMGVNPSELVRVTAAVRTNWNTLTHILTGILLRNVYAYWGRVGGQPKFGDQTLEHMRAFDKVLEELTGKQPQRISLPGGAGQFYIPNMTRNVHIQRGVRVPVADVIAGKVDIY